MSKDDSEGISPGGFVRPRSTGKRQELIRATLRVLERDGWSRLTARKVVAEAGLSLGHITYNFPSMDALLAAAYRQLADDLRAASDAAEPGNPGSALDRLAVFLNAAFTEEFLAPGHLRMRIDLWSAALAHPELAQTEAELYDRYRERLTALLIALADGHGTEAEVPAVADTIMAALDGLWLDWARRRDGDSVRRSLDTLIGLARLSLAPEESGGHGAGPDPSPR